MSDRVQPGGRVDEQVYEKFKQFVRDRHGTTRGVLGEELEKAMRQRMNAERGNDQLTRIENDVATIKAQLAEIEADGGETVSRTPHEPSGPRPTPSDGENTHARPESPTTHGAHEPRDRPDHDADRDPADTRGDSQATREAEDEDESDDDGHGLDPEDLDLVIPDERPAENAARVRKVGYLVGLALERFSTGFMGRDHLRELIRDEFGFGDRTLTEYEERLVERLGAKAHPHNPDDLLVFGEAIERVREQVREQAETEAQREQERLENGRTARQDKS